MEPSFKTHTLNNGLQIIAEINPPAESLAAGFFVRTGSRDETAEVSGVSHFLEHMLFKGTDRRSAADVNLDFDRLGALYNAFTGHEYTVYFAAVLPEFQQPMLDILCDIMRPALREEDFEMEKGVILEEIAMYEDRPHFRLMDNIMRQHFGEHPMGNSILGTNESITALRRDNMLDYFARRYAPSNVILTAVGNVDFDALVAQADSLCGGWDDYDVSRDTTDEPGTHTSATMVDQRLARQNIAFLSHAPSAQSDDRYAAELLATVIGDATGSRLYYALIEPAIADEASVSYSSADGTGVLMTMLSCDPDRSGEAVAIARDELQTFATDGPTDAELQAAKNKIASTDTIKGELPMGRLTSVGFEWQYRRDYQTLPQQIEQLFAVTREDIIDVARRYAITQATILALGPQENPLP